MGCWNETCALSGLPIRAYDQMVVVLITRSSYFDSTKISNSRCYATAFWEPIGFPIYGKYNDYGWIEDVEETPLLDYTLDYVDRHMVEREQGENEYHDIPVKRGQMDVEYLGELIHEGRLLFPRTKYGNEADNQEDLPVGAMMMRRDIFEKTISSFTNNVYREVNGHYDYVDVTNETIRDEFRVELTKHLAKENRIIFSRFCDRYDRILSRSRLDFSESKNILEPLVLEAFCVESARCMTLHAQLELMHMHYGLRQSAGQECEWKRYRAYHQMIIDTVDAITDRDDYEDSDAVNQLEFDFGD